MFPSTDHRQRRGLLLGRDHSRHGHHEDREQQDPLAGAIGEAVGEDQHEVEQEDADRGLDDKRGAP